MKLKYFEGGFDKNLSYLLWCENTLQATIVDPAVDSNEIIEFIQNNNLILSKIIITHTHYDHIKYLNDFVFLYPEVEVCLHKKSKKIFDRYNIKSLSNQETISIGEILIISIYTPGHYHDSICYWIKNENILFTGDTLFVGRPGRTISPTSNIKHLYNSLYEIIFKLPQEINILPGHNYGHKRTISIKENKLLSNFFQCSNLKEFAKIMQKFEEKYKK